MTSVNTNSDARVDATGGALLARQLVAEGVDVIFGVPGAQLDWAVDGLAQHAPSIRFVHARHEQGAAYMADGYARSTGRVGVFMVVPGPGMLNASAALSTAWACSSPVVAIVARIPQAAEGRRLGVLHEIDGQSEILAKLTKWQGLATRPEDVPAMVSEGFRQARSGRPRPVVIEIPQDVLAGSGSGGIVAPLPPALARAAARDIEIAATALRRALRPVIVAGNGVVAADGQAALVAIAEHLDVPVAATTNGRSAIDSRHPLALVNAAGRELLADADVILAVGTRFVSLQGTILATAAARTLIQLNADPADLGGERHSSVDLLSDARLGLEDLLAEIRRQDSATPDAAARGSRTVELSALRAWCETEVDALEPLAGFVRALRSALPDDGFVVADLTQVGYLANAAFPVFAPRSYLTAGWQGTLGFAFPTALGVKVAHPDRAVIAIAGDGGFGFCLNELATAAAHGIALVTVVFSDGAFGNVRRTQATTFQGRYLATELANPDFVALAEAFGIDGILAADAKELERAVADAIAGGRPTVVVVPVGTMPSPWHLLTDKPSRALPA